MKEKKKRWVSVLFFVILAVCMLSVSVTVSAVGFVDSKIDAKYLFSKYPLDNYQLDFYVDTSWDWLPWNWGEGIGDAAIYAVYVITNVIWYASTMISSATGYVVQEAFGLDFIKDMTSSVGKSMQTLAGISRSGISSSGLYGGFLLALIVVLGVYVAYTGIVKRETSKAMDAVLSFLLIFIVSSSFIAFAPDYISKINSFSSDVSKYVLNNGTKLITSDSGSTEKSGEIVMRENLFSVQIRKPWLLLQFGNTDESKIGKDRVKAVESVSPDKDDGETRDDAVKKEIEDNKNKYMAPTKVAQRLGMVLFLFIFNLLISVFVLFLTGYMLLSQIMFVMMALFVPFVCVLSMLPGHGINVQKCVLKLFNILMVRSGITLVVCMAFSISALFYGLSGGYPFFMVMFLQIITFAGIALKLGDILEMFGLGTQGGRGFRMMGSRARRGLWRMERRLRRGMRTGNRFASPDKRRFGSFGGKQKESIGKRAGRKAGSMRDAPKRALDKAKRAGEKVKDAPVHAKYAAHSVKEGVKNNAKDFKKGMEQEKHDRETKRAKDRADYRKSVGEKQKEMERPKKADRIRKEWKADRSMTEKTEPENKSKKTKRQTAGNKKERRADRLMADRAGRNTDRSMKDGKKV